jgi:hypothetical protein
MKRGQDITPRACVLGAKGNWLLPLPLDGHEDRLSINGGILQLFCTCVLASAFVLTMPSPDGFVAYAATRCGGEGFRIPVYRDPVSFGRWRFIRDPALDNTAIACLPPRQAEISAKAEFGLAYAVRPGGEYETFFLGSVPHRTGF